MCVCVCVYLCIQKGVVLSVMTVPTKRNSSFFHHYRSKITSWSFVFSKRKKTTTKNERTITGVVWTAGSVYCFLLILTNRRVSVWFFFAFRAICCFFLKPTKTKKTNALGAARDVAETGKMPWNKTCQKKSWIIFEKKNLILLQNFLVEFRSFLVGLHIQMTTS